MGIAYGTVERIRFGEPVLGMALVLTQRTEIGYRRSDDDKSEYSCNGDRM